MAALNLLLMHNANSNSETVFCINVFKWICQTYMQKLCNLNFSL